MKKIAAKFIRFTIITLLSGIFVSAGVPLTLIENDMNQILSIVSNPSLKGDEFKTQRREQIRKILATRFHFEEMSKRALGKEWKKADSEQQKEFVALFRNLLENTYIEKMEMYTGEKITMGKEDDLGDGKFSVETFIALKTGDVPIFYKLLSKIKDEYLVYDVIIEGVGLIQNYRSQFKKILDQENFEGLLKKLRDKKGE